jgi:hypothetical protein
MRREKIEWYLECVGDEAKRCRGTGSAAILDVGNMPLAEVCLVGEIHLRDVTPLPQDTNRVLAFHQTIHNVLWQQGSAGGDLLARTRHETGSVGILIGFGSLGNERFVFLARQDCDLAACRLLKSNVHGTLSVVHFSLVSDCDNDDCIAVFIENHTPIANAKPCALAARDILSTSSSRPRHRPHRRVRCALA